jgi:hypothetical protein
MDGFYILRKLPLGQLLGQCQNRAVNGDLCQTKKPFRFNFAQLQNIPVD